MAFEDLSHTPTFDLPDYGSPIPPDALSILEEYHRGLHRVVISKQVRRDNYEMIATITTQDSGNSKTHPSASPDEIGEYVMLCIQWEMDKSDAPGIYRMKIFGAPGKGRFEKAKHIDMRGEGDAKDIQVLTEGELTEQQSQYIGELHSQLVAQNEVIMGMVKPLLSENKEMMKILSEAVKNNAEVEAIRNKHAIEMKIHNDEVKLQEEEADQKMKRWMELLNMVKETGAHEAVFKALAKKLNQVVDDSAEKKKKNKEEKEQEQKEQKEQKQLEESSKKTKKKKKKKKKPQFVSKETEEAVGEMEDDFLREGLAMVEKSPLVLCAQGLKLTIDDKDQWPLIKETLTDEQYEQMIMITECASDKELKEKLKALYEMRGIKRLINLGDHLDENQSKFLDELIKAAME